MAERRRFASGDRVHVVLDATVTHYDEDEEELTVHYSSTLGTFETVIATDSSYVRIEGSP